MASIPSPVTRRAWLGGLAGGAALAACAPGPAPTLAPGQPAATPAPPRLSAGQTLVTLMHQRNELSEKEQQQFEAANPTIRLYLINNDHTALMAMTAAGNPPDLFRLQAPDVPGFLARKMLRDLTPNFKLSAAIKLDDLAEANKSYMYTGMAVGGGNIYGMCKDWSPDLTLYANKKLFAAAGVALPSDETRLSYQDVAQYAQRLTKKAGDRVEVVGFGYANDWLDRIVEAQLNTEGASLWAPDFGRLNATAPEARKALAYWFELARANVTFNPLNPAASWSGDQFTKEQVAITQYGYWFSAMAESDKTKGNVVKLPSPTWGPNHKNPTITATGAAIHARTNVPDQTWTAFEWYNAKEPAVARAKSGWGVPALKSLYQLMPSETPFQKQVQKVLQGELRLADVAVRFNPYIAQNTFPKTWTKHLEAALKGQLSFDQLLTSLERDVNEVIKEGQERLK
jgi:multiple sugar transport system substrate-binding protein